MRGGPQPELVGQCRGRVGAGPRQSPALREGGGAGYAVLLPGTRQPSRCLRVGTRRSGPRYRRPCPSRIGHVERVHSDAARLFVTGSDLRPGQPGNPGEAPSGHHFHHGTGAPSASRRRASGGYSRPGRHGPFHPGGPDRAARALPPRAAPPGSHRHRPGVHHLHVRQHGPPQGCGDEPPRGRRVLPRHADPAHRRPPGPGRQHLTAPVRLLPAQHRARPRQRCRGRPRAPVPGALATAVPQRAARRRSDPGQRRPVDLAAGAAARTSLSPSYGTSRNCCPASGS